MESKVKLLGHPVHAMLTDFPAALFTATVVFDVIGLLSGSQQFATVSWWTLSMGLMLGLLAALFGLIDWLGIRSDTRAKRVGMCHGLGNLVVVLLFVSSWWLRLDCCYRTVSIPFRYLAMQRPRDRLGDLLRRLPDGLDSYVHERGTSQRSDVRDVKTHALPRIGRHLRDGTRVAEEVGRLQIDEIGDRHER